MTKKELLNNPLVKEIATEFNRMSKHALTTDTQDWEQYVTQVLNKKDYEILSFHHKALGTIWVKLENKNFIDSSIKRHEHQTQSPESYFLRLPEYYYIYSVRRLSDGEVFTVGYTYGLKHTSLYDYTVTEFRIHLGEMMVLMRGGTSVRLDTLVKRKPLLTTHDGVAKNVGDYVTIVKKSDKGFYGISCAAHQLSVGSIPSKVDTWAFSTAEVALEWIAKYQPKLLLKTDDGVDIYDNMQSLYLIRLDSDMNPVYTRFIAADLIDYRNNYNQYKDWKVFSTEEKRKHFLLLNRPVLSVQDVLDCMHENGILDSKKLQDLSLKRVK